jgi:flavin reductase (DIM6/NTAB) family NADH-FMN oxidoreductase RutF
VRASGRELTATTLRAAFGAFPSGVTAVAGLRDGVPRGLAASSFTSVSIDPPLVSVCVAHTSTTWPSLHVMPRLGLSVLAQDQDELCRALAARTADRFAGVGWEASDTGAVFVHGAALWLECSVVHRLPAGDHDLALLRVHRLTTYDDVPPLVFHGSRFRQLAV